MLRLTVTHHMAGENTVLMKCCINALLNTVLMKYCINVLIQVQAEKLYSFMTKYSQSNIIIIA